MRLPPADPWLAGAGWALMMAVGLFLLSPILLGLLLSGPAGPARDASLVAGTWLMASLPFAVLLRTSPQAGRAVGIGPGWLRPRTLAMGAFLWLGGLFIWAPSLAAYGLLLQALGVANPPQPVYREIAETLTAGRPDPILLLLAGLVLPFFEEFAFRGVLQGALRRFFPRMAAGAMAAAFFAFLHSPLTVVPPVFLLGLLFAYVRERTGSLGAAWVAHALHNSVAIALAPALLPFYDSP